MHIFFVQLFRVPLTDIKSLVRAHEYKGQPFSLNLPSPKPGHTTSASSRVRARRRMAGPEGTSTARFAKETFVARAHQDTEESFPERFFGSAKSANSLIRI